MKKTLILLHIAVCALFMLSSLLFAAIEIFQLFSGDWKLFENEILAFMQIAAKILLSFYCFAISIRAVIRNKQPFLFEGIQLLLITLSAAPFVSNNFGWLFVVPAALFLISDPSAWSFLSGKIRKTKETSSNF